MIVSVSDQAGNEMKARTLFIFDATSDMEIDEDNPLYVANADQNTGYTWIHSHQSPDGEGEDLNVTWAMHFINR